MRAAADLARYLARRGCSARQARDPKAARSLLTALPLPAGNIPNARAGQPKSSRDDDFMPTSGVPVRGLGRRDGRGPIAVTAIP
jgi:hypothetical protein